MDALPQTSLSPPSLSLSLSLSERTTQPSHRLISSRYDLNIVNKHIIVKILMKQVHVVRSKF